MKKGKKILVIFALIVFVVLIEILSYKVALLQYNKPISGTNYKTLEKVKDKIEIVNVENTNLKSYLDISYPMFNDNFEFMKEKSTDEYNSYYLYTDDESYTLLASYQVGFASNYLDELEKTEGIKVKEVKRLLEKYEINNNFDVLEYLRKNYDNKVNLLSKKDDIMMRYLMNSFANNKLVKGSIRYITGDLEGFMIISEDKSLYEVNLKKDNMMYYFSFANGSNDSYFNEDYIINFLNSVSFYK